jgi:putative MATE family efflux protein
MPAFFGMFVMTLYNVVDTIFVGKSVGPLGIAGLSIGFPLQMLTMGIGMMVGLGGASLISRMLGAGNNPRAEHALGNAITANLVLSILVSLIILSNLDYWLRLIGASDNVLPLASDYLGIVMFGMIFATSSMAFVSLIRAEGNARVSMIGMIMGAGLNIVLDAIFIIPLKMGIQGAALATVISQFISIVYMGGYYLTGSSYLKIRIRNLIPELDILKSIFAIGIASFARTIATSLSAMLVINTVVSFGGDVALSGFGIVQRIMMFAIMPSIVIGQGLQPILGFNYGAKRFNLALRAILLAMIASIILSTIVFLVLYFMPEPIIGIFTDDAGLIDLTVYATHRIFIALPLVGFLMVGSLVFQSIGKAAESFATAVVRPVLFLVPAVLLLSNFIGLDGVWYAFPISDTLTLLLTVLLLLPIIRDFRKAAASGEPGDLDESVSGPVIDRVVCEQEA